MSRRSSASFLFAGACKRGVLGLVFFSVLLNSLPVFAREIKVNRGLVYCPLQKLWVDPAPPPPVKARDPLNTICAPNDDKLEFLLELTHAARFKRVAISADDAEALFFDFAENGRQALAAYLATRELPGGETPKLRAAGEHAAGPGRSETHHRKQAQANGCENFARPPTTAKETPVHRPTIFDETKSVSPRIAPRAPPFFI